MGQKLTKNACVNLGHLPAEIYEELTSETYTVVRTGGWEQHGWRIPTMPHQDCSADATDCLFMERLACNRINASGYVEPLDGERFPWRVYMVFAGEDSSMETKRHACGWRRSAPGERTFWPTRLDGNAEAQEAWGLRLDGLLNGLKSDDELEAGEKAVADAAAAKVATEAERLRELEIAYQADEPARYAAGKALEENPVATTGMMIQMRQRESTGARCLRNNAIPIPPGGNFALKIKELEAISVHDADRLRRLFDNGCPKAIVFWLAGFHHHHANRNQFITEEESKLFLEPLAQPVMRPLT
jgi:hypothetical protein